MKGADASLTVGAFESAPTARGAVNAVGLGLGDTADVIENGTFFCIILLVA